MLRQPVGASNSGLEAERNGRIRSVAKIDKDATWPWEIRNIKIHIGKIRINHFSVEIRVICGNFSHAKRRKVSFYHREKVRKNTEPTDCAYMREEEILGQLKNLINISNLFLAKRKNDVNTHLKSSGELWRELRERNKREC